MIRIEDRVRRFVLKIISVILISSALLLLLTITTSYASSHISITEIKYDTSSSKNSECSDVRFFEWVELYSLGKESDLNGWFIGDSGKQNDKIKAEIGGTTTIIPKDGYLIVASKKACFLQEYPSFSGNIASLESYFGSFGLNNDGDRVVLCEEVADCGVDGAVIYKDYPDKAVSSKSLSYALLTDNTWGEAESTPGAANGGGTSPSPTPTPSPSATPVPSPSPSPTSKPKASPTPTPTPSPKATGLSTTFTGGAREREELVLGIQEAHSTGSGQATSTAAESEEEGTPQAGLVAGLTSRSVLAGILALAGLLLLAFSAFVFYKDFRSGKIGKSDEEELESPPRAG